MAQTKNFSSLVISVVCWIVLCTFLGCSSSPKVAVRPNEHMEIGWTPRTIFQAPSYAAWFDTGYEHYQPQEEYVARLRRMKDSVDILIVYGTWCSDSRRELPRFWKVVDSAQFPADHITMIAVDRTMQLPAGVKQEHNITNVPTFMIKFRGTEIGRIIESPKSSMEEDLVGWLSPFFP
jgi:thiol-disulfide isomerase/thioredoxin